MVIGYGVEKISILGESEFVQNVLGEFNEVLHVKLDNVESVGLGFSKNKALVSFYTRTSIGIHFVTSVWEELIADNPRHPALKFKHDLSKLLNHSIKLPLPDKDFFPINMRGFVYFAEEKINQIYVSNMNGTDDGEIKSFDLLGIEFADFRSALRYILLVSSR